MRRELMLEEVLPRLTGEATDYNARFSWASDNENDMIKKLWSIGENYRKVKQYYLNRDIPTNGLYTIMFKYGLERCCFQYCDSLAKISDRTQQFPETSLTRIYNELIVYDDDFRLLLNIICTVRRNTFSGCQLFNMLHDIWTRSVNRERDLIAKILQPMQSMFFDHMCSLIFFGEIQDDRKEFVIVSVADHAQKTRKISTHLEMMPYFLDAAICRDIIVIAEGVRAILEAPLEPKTVTCFSMHDVTDVWHGKMDELIAGFEELRAIDVWDRHLVAEKFAPIKKHFSQVLRQMMMDCDPMNELKSVRDYLLLGNGLVTQEFIRATSHLYHKRVQSVRIQELNLKFTQAWETYYWGFSDARIKNFQLYFNQQQSSDLVSSNLHMRYNCQWPLTLLFNDPIPSNYARVYEFLLRIRVCQTNLNRFWLNNYRSNMDARVLILRMRCSFFIDNLYYYLQEDVIGSEFTELMERIRSSDDFFQIIHAHEQFVSNVFGCVFIDETAKQTNNQKESLEMALIMKLLEIVEEFNRASVTFVEFLTDTEKSHVTRMTTSFMDALDFLLQKCRHTALRCRLNVDNVMDCDKTEIAEIAFP